MKKTIYLLTISLLFSFHAFSQDKIYKKNGDIVEAKVIEIAESEIKYKVFTDQDGPIYSVDKDRISKIIYHNGREETYQNSLKDTSLYTGQAKKAIKLNFLSPLIGYTQLSYEQNLKPGRSYELTMGIIGLGKRQKTEEYNYYSDGISTSNTYYRKAAGVFLGAGYKFIKLPNFVRNGDKYSHILQGAYAKPELILGGYSQVPAENSFYDQSNNRIVEKETVLFGAFIINLGKQWILGESFLLDLYGGIGYGADNEDNSTYDSYNGNHFGLNIAGDSGIGFTGGLKVGLLLNKKKN
ncbi:hypothetical protein [Arcticibacter eurypsychrophilus]|uniref:hypothetical protein n=1 Tax=Arcticibacter eurypsychrophilus TaxID=1434752 RepID=UPI00084D1DE2|nr:hypothetical protein [Arcticibacter eurypsychrophilus]